MACLTSSMTWQDGRRRLILLFGQEGSLVPSFQFQNKLIDKSKFFIAISFVTLKSLIFSVCLASN